MWRSKTEIIVMRQVEVECMICGKGIKVEIPNSSTHLSLIFTQVAKDFRWQTTTIKDKIFICCEKCYEKAYDPENKMLRKSKKHLMIEDVEI